MVGDPPELEDRASDQFFGRLCDTGRFDLVWIRTRIRRWMIVFEPIDVNVVSCVWVLSPAQIHSFRVRVVEFVIITGRPLDVDSGLVGPTQSVVKYNFEDGWMEVVVEFSCCERFHLLDDVTNRQ
nr:hypothetical protein [Halobacterium hubeiense]